MARTSRRRRGTSTAVKARQSRPPGVTYSTEQVQALLATSQQARLSAGNTDITPLATSPFWSAAPFGPGFRLVPKPVNIPRPSTGRPEPRLDEYPVSWNIQIGGRRHVPWKTLTDAAQMPLFRKCIERRKGVCSLGFTVTVDPKAVAREAAATGQAEKDIESTIRKQSAAEIARISDWLEWPDRGNGWDWEMWTRQLMENALVYDATVVYPRRDYGGKAYSFEVPDGQTFKPLIDEFGRRPLPPYPAYQQIIYGFPRGEFTADTDPADTDPATGKPRVPGGFDSDTLIYERRIIRPGFPNGYGMPPTEIALLDGLVWMRRMGWILAEYTDGVQPSAFLKTDAATDWTVEQWEDWSAAINDHLSGNTRARQRWPLMPPGVEPVQSAEVNERYKPEYDMFLVKLIAGDFGLTATELGFPEVGSLGASFHEGEEDVLNRVTRVPDAKWLAKIATRLAVRQLGMPPVLQVQILGLESEDEATQDQVADARVKSGRMTYNEDRARIGQPPYQFPEADMPVIVTQRGVVFLEGASQQAQPGVLVEPAHTTEGAGGADAQPGQPGQAQPRQAAASQQQPAAKAKDTATAVYEQVAEDYPPAAMGWIHHATWQGPVNVPTSHIDMSGRKTWAANKETSKVEHFKAKIQAKGKTKPVILVKTPGKAKLSVIDGHHRTLAYDELGLPVRAYIGTVTADKGPWDEMHDRQFDTEQETAARGKADDTAYSSAADKSAAAELKVLRGWLAKRSTTPARPFQCQALTALDAAVLAPDLLADARVVLKASDAGPKALACAGRGPAGSGT